MSPEFDCRCAVPDWRETIFDTYICLRCGTTAAPQARRKEKPSV